MNVLCQTSAGFEPSHLASWAGSCRRAAQGCVGVSGQTGEAPAKLVLSYHCLGVKLRPGLEKTPGALALGGKQERK